MSLIGKIKLDEAVFKHDHTHPADILNELDRLMYEVLHNEQPGALDIRDGMDIALIAIDKEQGTLEFSGAFRPLTFVRNNEIIEIKGTPEAIAGDRNSHRNFESHTINMEKGDAYCLFSDGYVDQFGGPRDRKFMKKRFHKLLLSIQDKPMQEQCPFLKKTFQHWKGNGDQVDDVMVLGFKYQ